MGPSLIDSPVSAALVGSIVSNGIGSMPGFSGALTAQQIELVGAYVAAKALASPTTNPNGDGGAGGVTQSESAASPAEDPGATLFSQNCASCHGANGEGGVGDPLNVYIDDEELISAIGRGPGDMPGFSDILSQDEIRLIADHVHTLEATTTTSVAGAIEVNSAKAPSVAKRGPARTSIDTAKRLAEAPEADPDSVPGFPLGVATGALFAAAGLMGAWLYMGERTSGSSGERGSA